MSAPSHPAARGFYVFQAALGSPLQFHPALGTAELDTLMDAYLPCPGTIQDKRASISVDFFDHFRLTGESIKFYEVPGWVNSATSSPNSAQDSGYGSSFTASPLAPTWSWGTLESTAVSTPSTSSSVSTPQIPSRRTQQSSRKQSTSSRAGAGDFSSLPGMKILTRDGRDVTNTATRGCKTKEQRDHAHLMRIMKACDSCKRKKVRCDPSHRALTSPATPAQQPTRAAKKARISSAQPKAAVAAPSFEPAIFDNPPSLPALPDSFEFGSFDFLNETSVDEQASWDEFLRYNGELDSVFPDAFDHLPNLQPTVPSAPTRPPASDYPDPCDVSLALTQSEAVASQGVPGFPYMENDQPHDYVDFNLYSPTSSFSDSEPLLSKDLSVEPISRLEGVGRQGSCPGLGGQLVGSTMQQPEDPITRVPDHRQSSLSPEQQPQRFESGASASLETDLSTHVSSSASESPDSQELLSMVGGWMQPSSTDTQLSRDASQQPRTSHVPRTTPESDSSQSPVVNGTEITVRSSISSQSQSQSVVTTRQGDHTAAAAATQATATADTQRPGRDLVARFLSEQDERASVEVIDPYRGRPLETAEKHEKTRSKSSQPAAFAGTSSSDEQSRLENLSTATVVHDRTTLCGQNSSTAVTTSPLKQPIGNAALVDTETSPIASRSSLVPLGTDRSAAVQESSWTLISLEDLMSSMAAVAAFACEVVARQGRETDEWHLPARRIRTQRNVQMDTARTRIPVLA